MSPSTLRRRARAGLIAAVVDASGRYHFPRAGARKKRKKAPPAAPSRATKRPPFRKKRSKASAGSPRKKPPAPARKKTLRAPSTEPSIREVRESSSPTIREAAPDFGLRPSELARLVAAGIVRAVRDEAGDVRIPAVELQARQYAAKRRRKKRRAKGIVRPPPWMTGAEPPRRGKKKKKAGKLRPGKKKKRVRKTKPSRQRFQEAIVEDTRPSIYAPAPEKPPREISRARPMAMGEAAQRLGNAMRDFVMAGPRWERLQTGRVFHDLKVAFRKAYTERRWRATYAWIVDEWGLDDYVFDYEALRDS